jgi:hypothetical protein
MLRNGGSLGPVARDRVGAIVKLLQHAGGVRRVSVARALRQFGAIAGP